MLHRRNFLLLLAATLSSTVVSAGAWSQESFDNDGALDWVIEFIESPTSAFVRQTLTHAANTQSLDSFAGECAIAAAEVVAASLGHPCKDFPEELQPIVAKNRSELRLLVPLAKAALKSVLGSQSRLRQNWSLHEEDLLKWVASVTELQARLL